ncbi:hypothetical protein ACFWN2_43855 [Lentzea sp. NPDC058436]|uniref:hypothetical protein n=1 Tax=Lentzea sp. NPDC058436 TaxID=3346499 RepID=UPI003665A4B0
MFEGYQPIWLNGVAQVMTAHAARLRDLVGRKLTHAWLVWDTDADEWFADGPVLLDFAGEQFEVNHQKLDDLSLTWNTADPLRPITGSPHLTWRDNTLTALHDRTLTTVDLLESTADDLAHGSVAVGLGFDDTYVTIYNALDENALEFGPPRLEWRRHPVAHA